jgi:hypothetical protein
MDTRASLEGLVNVLPQLPAESIDSMLPSLDMLLEYGGAESRAWAVEAIRKAAQAAAHPGGEERLLALAQRVAAGEKTAAAPFSMPAPMTWVEPRAEPDSEEEPEREPQDVAKIRPPRKPGKLSEFKSLNARKASVATLGGFRPTFDPLATKFGFKPVARPDEQWPAIDGRPMLFVCQLNLAQAPAVPELLRGVALLTFFLEFEKRKDGDGDSEFRFELRTYESAEGLVTLEPPAGAPALRKGFECRWEAVDDYPCPEDPDAENPRDLDLSEVELPNDGRTKIGGWPSLVQAELSWQAEEHPARPRYCLQIASEEKASLGFGDAGTLYLGRGTATGFERQWFLDWQAF